MIHSRVKIDAKIKDNQSSGSYITDKRSNVKDMATIAPSGTLELDNNQRVDSWESNRSKAKSYNVSQGGGGGSSFRMREVGYDKKQGQDEFDDAASVGSKRSN